MYNLATPANDILSSMNGSTYKARRVKLSKYIGHSDYVVTAFNAVQQTNDAAAPFIQEANFWYLTGIEEPGWTLVVSKDAVATLIAPDISEVHRIFDGGLSDEAAQEVSGVDLVVSKKEGDVLLDNLLKSEEAIGVIADDPYEKYHSFAMNEAPKKLYAHIVKNANEVFDIRQMLANMRAAKTAEEVEAMRRAIDLTVDAFEAVKEKAHNLKHEYNLDAEFTYAFRNHGATHAYEPIVAAGKNACTLHYQKNSAELPGNGLVLMDVGARMGGYCADITRTYAIGTPSQREIDVHAAVEHAHRKIIALLAPGLKVKEYHDSVDEIMRDALSSLGLLNKPDDYRTYFPHAISHGLGIDVHDSLGGPVVFEQGMVLTVEPGIYIPEEGIGVRIEDDILITETGHENLSGKLSTAL